jgi:hypothetical protein
MKWDEPILKQIYSSKKMEYEYYLLETNFTYFLRGDYKNPALTIAKKTTYSIAACFNLEELPRDLLETFSSCEYCNYLIRGASLFPCTANKVSRKTLQYIKGFPFLYKELLRITAIVKYLQNIFIDNMNVTTLSDFKDSVSPRELLNFCVHTNSFNR